VLGDHAIYLRKLPALPPASPSSRARRRSSAWSSAARSPASTCG